jgi:uncharacterized damage-inducible protein DinB
VSETRAILAELRSKRREHDAELMRVTAQQMTAPVAFTLETMMTGRRGETTGAVVRHMFLRRPDHLEEHALQVEDCLRNQFAIPRTQTHLIWAANQVARGDLQAALVGLTDDDLDDRPRQPEGEWSLRQILEHVIVVERYYTLDALHALERFRAGEPHGELPQDELPVERPGASLRQLIDELDQARDEALAALVDLNDAELRAPSRWGSIDIDVRFLLMRCAHHEREHTDQIRTWRVQCDKPAGEADRLLGLCWQRGGALEGTLIGAPDDALDRDPGDGMQPMRGILAHIGSAESFFRRMIVQAL